MAHEHIVVETEERVGIITLDRPDALNALNGELMAEVRAALARFEGDSKIGCVVLTGGPKVFAAGADIKAMAPKTWPGTYEEAFLADWQEIAAFRKPLIAAVSGYALGGGCELAMMCDIIIAGDTAKFGQPEIQLGTMPGAGGTQRLTRAIGKSKAMYLCLTGKRLTAEEAERAGLVAKVVPSDELMDTAKETARTIAAYSLPVTMMIKDAIQQADEADLTAGIRYERGLFHATFGTEDQKEGMSAFTEKRKPQFKHR